MKNQQTLSQLPEHVAIIMDGNGRWAQKRGRERFYGHVKGARVAKKIIEYSAQSKLAHLTLYAFSEENWARPEAEVNFLMRLLSRYILREKQALIKNNIQFRCIGQLDKLPSSILKTVRQTIEDTASNTGMVLTFAISYGGRQEVTKAVCELAEMVKEGKINPNDISEELISSKMQSYPNPDPDLLIRTSGEWRLSNFLPWQSVYSELYFSETLWPDFTVQDFENALFSFSRRDRRFGKVQNKDRLGSSFVH